MNAIPHTSEARERIITVAAKLFYEQGYLATGINEVIKKAEVAKATFYAHFPSKNDLCLAYLKQRNHLELDELKRFVKQKRSPRSRFIAITEGIKLWLETNNLRGCQFLNMVPEVPDIAHPIRREGILHYQGFRALIRKTSEELIASDPKKYGGLDPNTITDQYLMILTGAIALTEIYHNVWPIKQAKTYVAQLID